MADDIDIEEHDVLESLRRRQMPAAAVKEEPVDEDYSELNYEPNNEYYHSEWAWESNAHEPIQVKVETPDDAEPDVPFGKIILGSKPPEPREESQPPEAGDKGSGHEEDIQNYNFDMSLVLEDWGPILERSNCFCPECQTLFATVNALDAHKMMAHSFLIAMDKEASPERNKAIKSTARPIDFYAKCEICGFVCKGQRMCRSNLLRHYRNVHQIDPLKLKSESELKNWKLCNHCNVYFPSDTALVKHLYELLPLNDKPEDEKPTPIKVQSAVKSSNVKPTSTVVRAERKPVKLDQVPTVSNVDTTPVPKPVVVKTVKQTPKQSNSIILGSKINGVRVDGTADNEAATNSTVRKCEVCGIEYSRKYYIVHMKKFHSDILLMKMNRLKKLQQVNVSTNVKYKCLVCHLMFEGPSSARRHRTTKHPEMKGRRMLVKIVKTSKIQKPKVKPRAFKIKRPTQSEDIDLVVSKSTLFKCNRCSVHFLTCCGACAHSRVCETSSNIRDWSCPQCQRVFKNIDKKAHQFQHQDSNAKFKVYVVYLEMVVRILCECPHCYVCFEEYKFWRHVKFGCERDKESFFCNECRLPIDTASKTSHESKHSQGDFTKEDFIKIEFISSNKEVQVKTEPKENILTPTLKRKLISPDVAHKTSSVIKDDLTLFYCPTCKNYMAKKVKEHVSGECRRFRKRNISCKFCGISFTINTGSSTHLRLHRKYPNITLSNLTFIRITDDKKMKPIPDYHACLRCNVNFMTKMSRMKHVCGKTKSFNCQVCQKKIDKASIKMHLRFHNYVIPGKGKTAQRPLQGNAKASTLQGESEVKSPTMLNRKETELPELLMKYQSLTTLWNILYVCETCDTFTDSYDKVVEHCQNHFINMESYGVVIMKCQICNMKFDRECYRRHLELHAGSTDISRKSFKILRYDHAKLFSTEWLKFIDLPEDQRTQILSRSIYGEKGYVRMRLEQQGPPEYTLYRCKLCLKCVNPEAIIHHMSLTNCLKANKLTCPHCSLAFVNRNIFKQHIETHEATHLEADSFRIVAFNDSIDADLNKKILCEYNAGELAAEQAPKTPDFFDKYPHNVKIVKGNKFYMFYKCVDCGICTLDAAATDHLCSATKTACPKCGLTFASNDYDEHAKIHEEISFAYKNVFTRAFSGRPISIRNAEKKDEARLYKCHCGLHFTSLKTIEKHYQSKNCSSVVREKCSHCYLLFDPNEIVNHLCKHHAQSQFHRFFVITPNKRTLFKCKQCHVLFYDKRIGAVHSEKCDGVPDGTRCDACGLAFDKLSIQKHRDEHKLSGQGKVDCYVVEDITNESIMDNNVLYKCKKCNVHYLEPASARNHAGIYNHQMHQVKKCNQCSLRFTAKTLQRHVELHHNLLKIDRFRIKCIPFSTRNDYEDDVSVFKVKVNESSVKETTREHAKTMNNGKAFKIYRCKKCKLHFTDGKTLLNHNEDRCSKELVEFCDFCSLKFCAKNIQKHYKQHNGEENINMDVTEENDANNDDEGNDDDDEKNDTATEDDDGVRYDIYRCIYCDYHFNLKKSCLSHISAGCDAVKGPPVPCHKCGISFTKISATRHQILHHKYNMKKDDFNIIDVSDPTKEVPDNGDDDKDDTVIDDNRNETDFTLYRCRTCGLHFNSKKSCVNHFAYGCDGPKSPPATCDECDVDFTKKSAAFHRMLHTKYNLKKDDFYIIDLSEPTKDNVDKNDTVTDGDEDIRNDSNLNIYKCEQCLYHFNIKDTLIKHTRVGCNKIKGAPVKCDECNISFTKVSATRHKSLHDNYNLKKADFKIIGSSKTNDDVTEDYDGDKNDTTTEDDDESRNDIDLNLYRCKYCGYHFNTRKSCLRHINSGCDATKSVPAKCEECKLYLTKWSFCRHKAMHERYNHKKEDFVIIHVPDADGIEVGNVGFVDDDSQSTDDNATVASLDSNVQAPDQPNGSKISADLDEVSTNDTNSTVEAETNEEAAAIQIKTKAKIRFYKCGDCNVYFMAKQTFQKHLTKHVPLNAKDYIECKLCGFQFIIAALQFHIKKHHEQEFKLEDVLVQEYHPSVLKNNLPDMEIYCAIDKEQSGLVSTSSDVNNVSKTIDTAVIENIYNKSETLAVDSTEVIITSNCNEVNEKGDALDKT